MNTCNTETNCGKTGWIIEFAIRAVGAMKIYVFSSPKEKSKLYENKHIYGVPAIFLFDIDSEEYVINFY